MATTTTPRQAPETTERRGKRVRPLGLILALAGLAAILGLVAWMVVSSGSDSPAELEATALEELVAQERAALDPYFVQSDPSGYVGMYADQVTYIDTSSGGRLENQGARD